MALLSDCPSYILMKRSINSAYISEDIANNLTVCIQKAVTAQNFRIINMPFVKMDKDMLIMIGCVVEAAAMHQFEFQWKSQRHCFSFFHCSCIPSRVQESNLEEEQKSDDSFLMNRPSSSTSNRNRRSHEINE